MDAKTKEAVQKWLSDNNFTEDGYTYIYFPKDSYDVKEDLKDAGFTFHKILMWHRNSAEGYEDKVIKIYKDEIMEFTVFGYPFFFEQSEKTIQQKMKEARPVSLSEWVGEPKDKLVELPVVLESKRGFSSRYGWTNIYTFIYNEKDTITWFTAKDIEFENGDLVYLSATIKELTTYDDVKQTVVTRAKVVAAQ